MSFMEHCSRRIGETYFRTPRTTITSFINLLAVLEQNPSARWEELLGKVDMVADTAPDSLVPDDTGEDDLASFKL